MSVPHLEHALIGDFAHVGARTPAHQVAQVNLWQQQQ
jgi:hypothetical protein